MANLQNLLHRSFSAGELAPNLHGRADLARYTMAARTLRNFIVLRGGGIANRGGFQFLGEVGVNDVVTLYRWAFTAADQSTLIELGDHYMRFWVGGVRQTVSGVDPYDSMESYDPGELVTDSGTTYVCIAAAAPADAPPDTDFWYPLTDDIYELPTPWASGAFNSPGMVRAAQDEFELLFSHPSAASMVLRNGNVSGSGNPSWSLLPFEEGPAIDPPTSLSVTDGTPGGDLNPVYVVTAIAASNREESLPSAPDTATSSGEATYTDPNVLSWTPPAQAALEYRVYKDPVGNGTFGYIGTATDQTTFNDPGYEPDFLQTPPIATTMFAAANDYPEACGYYQQRRLFGMTGNTPGGVWASRVGHVNNFTTRSPLQDDDAVSFRLRAAELQVVRHIIPLPLLVILTNTSEWVLHGDGDTGALTPSTLNPRQHGYAGSSRAFPSLIANTLVFVQDGGRRVRALRIDQQVEGLGSLDLSMFASHLFDDHAILRTEYQKDAGIIWALRDDGVLLGLTYLPEDDSFGWHRHDTVGGVIEDICVIPEAGEDVLYAVVNRDLEAGQARFIERIAWRPLTFDAETVVDDGVFVDCAITQDGAPTVTVTGLDHLEGEEVYGAADGVPFGPFTVTGGQISLASEASVVHVGLRVTAQLEPLDLDVQGTGVRDAMKRIQSIGVVVHTSGQTFYAGPNSSTLKKHQAPTYDATTVKSGYVEMNIRAGFSPEGRFLLQHTDATPLTILQLIPRFQVGG